MRELYCIVLYNTIWNIHKRTMDVNGFISSTSSIFLPHLPPMKCFSCGKRMGHISQVFGMVPYMIAKMIDSPSTYLTSSTGQQGDYLTSDLYKNVMRHMEEKGKEIWGVEKTTNYMEELNTYLKRLFDRYQTLQQGKNGDEEEGDEIESFLPRLYEWFQIHRLCCKRMMACQYNPNIEYLIYS